jgi:hypothetical protein
MNPKYYISITGNSTAGKTTLAHTLLACADKETIKPIRQVTLRDQRDDDDPSLIETIDEKIFLSQHFLATHGKYGILWEDFSDFCDSPQTIGISITGPNEIQQLKKQYELVRAGETVQVNCINIAIRFSNDYNTHKQAASDSLKTHFKNAVAIERASINDELDKTFFFNDEFLDKHIDILLSRESSIKEWISQIGLWLPEPLFEENIPENIWTRMPTQE